MAVQIIRGVFGNIIVKSAEMEQQLQERLFLTTAAGQLFTTLNTGTYHTGA